MNGIVNNFLLVGDKFMPEMNLRQLDSHMVLLDHSRLFSVRYLVDACVVRMFIFLSFNEDAALIR